MPATNSTTHYELPIFIGTDKPSWMGDWNGAMNKIDAALAEIAATATTAVTTANAASTTAQAAQTAVTALSGRVTDVETVQTGMSQDIQENTADIQSLQSQISQIPTGVNPLPLTIKKFTFNSFTPTIDLQFYKLGDQYFAAGVINFGTQTSSSPSPGNLFYSAGGGLPIFVGVGQIQGNPFGLTPGNFTPGNVLPNVLYSISALVIDTNNQHKLEINPQTSPGTPIKFYVVYDSVTNTTNIIAGGYVTYKSVVPFSIITPDPLTTVPTQTIVQGFPTY